MTRNERDEVMRYAGKIEAISLMLDDSPVPDEDGNLIADDGTSIVKALLMDLSLDLQSLAKGYDAVMPSEGR